MSERHYAPPLGHGIVDDMTNPTDTTPRPAVTADSAERADAVISTLGLSCAYGSFTAVDGVDLVVRRGELYALLGTNGAGKTTTLEVLEGIALPAPAASRCSAATRRTAAAPDRASA
nr:hypothetical protein GCM10025699_42620 [Microbacterium flavescens]